MKYAQEVIDQVMDIREELVTPSLVAERLNELDVPTVRGGKWLPTTVSTIVRREQDKWYEDEAERMKNIPKSKTEDELMREQLDRYGWAEQLITSNKYNTDEEGNESLGCEDAYYVQRVYYSLEDYENRDKNKASTDFERAEFTPCPVEEEVDKDFKEINYWLDLMNTDGAKPATVKRKLRQAFNRKRSQFMLYKQMSAKTKQELKDTEAKLQYVPKAEADSELKADLDKREAQVINLKHKLQQAHDANASLMRQIKGMPYKNLQFAANMEIIKLDD